MSTHNRITFLPNDNCFCKLWKLMKTSREATNMSELIKTESSKLVKNNNMARQTIKEKGSIILANKFLGIDTVNHKKPFKHSNNKLFQKYNISYASFCIISIQILNLILAKKKNHIGWKLDNWSVTSCCCIW